MMEYSWMNPVCAGKVAVAWEEGLGEDLAHVRPSANAAGKVIVGPSPFWLDDPVRVRPGRGEIMKSTVPAPAALPMSACRRLRVP